MDFRVDGVQVFIVFFFAAGAALQNARIERNAVQGIPDLMRNL